MISLHITLIRKIGRLSKDDKWYARTHNSHLQPSIGMRIKCQKRTYEIVNVAYDIETHRVICELKPDYRAYKGADFDGQCDKMREDGFVHIETKHAMKELSDAD